MPGMPGEEGPRGPLGIDGCNGTDGAMGTPGYPGSPGGRGLPGEPGPIGPRGDAGSGGINSKGMMYSMLFLLYVLLSHYQPLKSIIFDYRHKRNTWRTRNWRCRWFSRISGSTRFKRFRRTIWVNGKNICTIPFICHFCLVPICVCTIV